MEKIDLRKLIKGRLASTVTVHPDDIRAIEANALVVAKEVWELAVNKCKEKAETVDMGCRGLDNDGESVWMEHYVVDLNSIERVKQMI